MVPPFPVEPFRALAGVGVRDPDALEAVPGVLDAQAADLLRIVCELLAAKSVHDALVVFPAALDEVAAEQHVVLDVPGPAVAGPRPEARHARGEVSGAFGVVPDLDLVRALAPQLRHEPSFDVPHALRTGVDQNLHVSSPLW